MPQQEHRSSSVALPGPLRNAATALQRLPGVGMVGRVAGQALDSVGAAPPRARRLAVYTGAGVLGVAGVVEWPVAVTGAAVAWLTQPRSGELERSGDRERAGDVPVPGADGGMPGTEPLSGAASTTLDRGAESHAMTRADADPDLLGGGGPLTRPEVSTAPTDRTTG